MPSSPHDLDPEVQRIVDAIFDVLWRRAVPAMLVMPSDDLDAAANAFVELSESPARSKK